MKILELTKSIQFIGIKNLENFDVESLSCDSSENNKNGIYFCLVGANFDGHKFYLEAKKMGAKCLVVEKYIDYPIMQILVDNARLAMAKIASKFFELDKSNLKLIGITGTNGKTTTSFLVKAYLAKLKKSVGLIGTEGIYINNLFLPSKLTTPDPINLCKILHEMALNGVEYVVMEVSAHALALSKVDGLNFSVMAITNVTQDHLDFFKSMNNYFKTKASFFDLKYGANAVINIDDDYCAKIARTSECDVMTVSLNGDADIRVENCELLDSVTQATLICGDNSFNIKTNLIGRYNLSNTLMAIGILFKLGFSQAEIQEVAVFMELCVPGRYNLLATPSDFRVIVDYAHTPDGVLKVLKTTRELTTGRIICVFGCGGNRDVKKRHIMGEISEKLADFTIVTSDNPRDELPILIIRDIVENMKKNYLIEEDRQKAINKALDMASAGDVVLLLGKGAENYQEIKGRKFAFSDYQVVDEYFREQSEKLHDKNLA